MGESAELGVSVVDDVDVEAWFNDFVATAERRLRHALVAALGQQAGAEAASIALAYAWEHRRRLCAMSNPAGYVYRVGRTRVGRRKREPHFLPVPVGTPTHVEPRLPDALGSLTERQRVAVMMVHADGWTRNEAAEALGITVSSLDTHLARGLRRLRSALGVEQHG